MAGGTQEIESRSVEQTLELGRALGESCRGGEVIALIGELGSGKSLFTKGLAAGLGIDRPDHVTSPTFVIINEYPGRLRLYHVDAYRLGGADDLDALGIEEIIESGGVVAIEWADRVSDCIPSEAITIRIDITGDSRRRLIISWPRCFRFDNVTLL